MNQVEYRDFSSDPWGNQACQNKLPGKESSVFLWKHSCFFLKEGDIDPLYARVTAKGEAAKASRITHTLETYSELIEHME